MHVLVCGVCTIRLSGTTTGLSIPRPLHYGLKIFSVKTFVQKYVENPYQGFYVKVFDQKIFEVRDPAFTSPRILYSRRRVPGNNAKLLVSNASREKGAVNIGSYRVSEEPGNHA